MQNSPFNIFRRNQRQLMIVLTGLAMFSFVFLDAVQNRVDDLPVFLWMILIGLFCAGGMWVVGNPRGMGKEWAVGGAIVGALVAFIGLRNAAPPPKIQTVSGMNLTNADLSRVSHRRSTAVRFVQMACSEAKTRPDRDSQFGTTRTESLAERQLRLAQVKKQGGELTDQAVVEWINTLTAGKLPAETYQKILKELGTSESMLFSILKEEILVNRIHSLEHPPIFDGVSLNTPAILWDDFRRLKVKQEISYAPVPTSAFVEKTDEPTDAEIEVYFSKYRTASPRPDGTPGFISPAKTKLAYLVANLETFEKKVAEPSDEEVKALYEKVKDARYREQAPPPADKPSEAEKPQDSEKKDAVKPDAAKEEAASKSDSPSKTEPAPETKPVADEKGADKGSTEKPAESKPADEKPAASDSQIGDAEMAAEFLFAQADDAAKAAAASSTEPPKSEKADEAKTEPAKSGADSAKDSPEPKKESTEGTPFRHRELDDEIRQELREEILKDRAFTLMQAAADAAITEMTKLNDKVLDAQLKSDTGSSDPRSSFAEALKSYAESHGLQYEEPEPASFEDLRSAEKFPIGMAQLVTGDSSPFQFRMPVAFDVFRNPQKYNPRRADSPKRDQCYAYWVLESLQPAPPQLSEPGVREKVIAALRKERSRPLAETRAKELVELAKPTDKPLADLLAGQTETGAAEGTPLEVKQTSPFSWLTRPLFAPQTDFRQSMPRLSTVPGLEGINEDFMRTVFDEMGEGETRVVPNADRSIYYIVRIVRRDGSGSGPAGDIAQKAVHQEFLGERFWAANQFGDFTPYDLLNYSRSEMLVQAWTQKFMQSNGIDPAQIDRADDSDE